MHTIMRRNHCGTSKIQDTANSHVFSAVFGMKKGGTLIAHNKLPVSLLSYSSYSRIFPALKMD